MALFPVGDLWQYVSYPWEQAWERRRLHCFVYTVRYGTIGVHVMVAAVARSLDSTVSPRRRTTCCTANTVGSPMAGTYVLLADRMVSPLTFRRLCHLRLS
jgi:hypothetical protein